MVTQFTITARAAEQIKVRLSGACNDSGLRVSVIAGGCSGFEYKMAVDMPMKNDQIIETNGARLLLDAKSMLHLNGTELDYKSELMQSGFVFNNPNVTGTCGCGTSFST